MNGLRAPMLIMFVLGIALSGCSQELPRAHAESWVKARIQGDMQKLQELSSPGLFQAIQRSTSPLAEEFDPLARPTIEFICESGDGAEREVVVDATDQGSTTRYTLTYRYRSGWQVERSETRGL